MTVLRKISRTVLSVSAVRNLFARLLRGNGVILMMHRFSDAELGIVGHDPPGVRRMLEFLRAERYDLVALDEMVRRLSGNGRPLDRTVAVTIDDGYLDQATIGASLFAEFDCPVTTFVTTGFLDGRLWFWWDKIRYVFRHTPRRDIRFEMASQEFTYTLVEAGDRQRAALDLVERAKSVSEEEKEAALQRLSAAAETEIPDRPPAEFAPMSWDQVRACERQGMAFGPHTVTHPILARTSADQCRREIVESWKRLRTEVETPVPVFCYPNGQQGDFGQREIAVLQGRGFAAGVTAMHGYNSAATFQGDPGNRYALRRFGYSDSLRWMIQVLCGAERLR
jgi:peptidoglycan/xylan/chitin deacetylase (PgdA/CDA1 family)